MLKPLSRVVSRQAARRIRYLPVTAPAAAPGPVRSVYRQIEQDFGLLAPPMVLHAASPPVLAAAWTLLRESLLAGGSLPRAEREVVAAGVSLGNECPYCVDVHGTAVAALRGTAVAEAVAAGRLDALPPAAQRLAAWARDSGRPAPLAGTGLSGPAAAEAGAVAVAFHYLNRVVNVVLGGPLLPADLAGPARLRLVGLIGRTIRADLQRNPAAGRSSVLLPAAAPPAGLGWLGDGEPARALGRAAAAFEAAGRRCLSEPARSAVTGWLEHWDGGPARLGRDWLAEPLRGLPAAELPAARLALLTAAASYRVGPADVEGFVRRQPEPGRLVDLLGWSAFSAATAVARRW